jgi:DNA-binding NarL/FixJ family response regulator
MLNLLLVEDNTNLRAALKAGLEATGEVRVAHDCDSGEAALTFCLDQQPHAILMDVQLAGAMNGIEAAIAIRRELPRLPVVFYSIQDDDAFCTTTFCRNSTRRFSH